MGYLFLVLAVLCGSIKGYCGKKTSSVFNTVKNMSLMSAVRMLLCVVIGFFFVIIFHQGFNGFIIDTKSILITLLSGLSTAFFIVTWIICVRKSAYSMLSIFLVLSTLIPVILCNILWKEEIKIFKIIGFCILLVSVIFMWIYNKKVKEPFKVKDVLMLILCATFNGLSLFAQKWRSFEVKETLSTYTFNFYTYLFALAILLIFALLTSKITKSEEKFELKKVFWYVLVLSICLFLNSLFNSMAADSLPSSILYPLSNGLGLIIGMLQGHFFFNEKINRYSIIGICLAIVSFVFMIL